MPASISKTHWRIAVATAIIWAASLFTFAFAHLAATCAMASHDTAFAVAGAAMAAGAVGAGAVSDRIGRGLTSRVMFGIGTLVCIASAAIHPEDTELLLVLAVAAGVAAGGSHVAAELLAEMVPAHFRSFVVLCFPATFLPVGWLQRGIEEVGWTYGIAFGSLLVAMSIAGLMVMPESERFLRLQHAGNAPIEDASGTGAAASVAIASGTATAPSSSTTAVRAPFAESGTVTNGGSLRSSATGICTTALGPDSRRAMTGVALLWCLLTLAYYLSSLTAFVPLGLTAYDDEMCALYHGGYGKAAGAGATGTEGTTGDADRPVSAGQPDAEIATDTASAVVALSSLQCVQSQQLSLSVFASGLHLLAAELLAMGLVAFMTNSRRMGRKRTLTFGFLGAGFSRWHVGPRSHRVSVPTGPGRVWPGIIYLYAGAVSHGAALYSHGCLHGCVPAGGIAHVVGCTARIV